MSLLSVPSSIGAVENDEQRADNDAGGGQSQRQGKAVASVGEHARQALRRGEAQERQEVHPGLDEVAQGVAQRVGRRARHEVAVSAGHT